MAKFWNLLNCIKFGRIVLFLLCIPSLKMEVNLRGLKIPSLRKGNGKYIPFLASLVLYIYAYYCKLNFNVVGGDLGEFTYNCYFFNVLLLIAMLIVFSTVWHDERLLKAIMTAYYADDLLDKKFGFEMSYFKTVIQSICLCAYGFICMIEFPLRIHTNLYQCVLHSFAFVLATAQTLVPLFLIEAILKMSCKRTTISVKIVEDIKERDTGVTEKLHDLMKINMWSVSSINNGNWMCPSSLLVTLFLLVHSLLLAVLFMYTLGGAGYEIVMFAFTIGYYYVNIVLAFESFERKSCYETFYRHCTF